MAAVSAVWTVVPKVECLADWKVVRMDFPLVAYLVVATAGKWAAHLEQLMAA